MKTQTKKAVKKVTKKAARKPGEGGYRFTDPAIKLDEKDLHPSAKKVLSVLRHAKHLACKDMPIVEIAEKSKLPYTHVKNHMRTLIVARFTKQTGRGLYQAQK